MFLEGKKWNYSAMFWGYVVFLPQSAGPKLEAGMFVTSL